MQTNTSNFRWWCVVAGVCAGASTSLAPVAADVPASDAPLEEGARSSKDLRRTARPDEWGGVPIVDLGKQRVPTSLRAQNTPTRIGVTISGGPGFAMVDLALDGLWDVTSRLEPIGRVRVRSEGADSLRLKFDEVKMPPGGVLRVYNAAGRMVGARGGDQPGPWWTASIEGETALVEYLGPADDESLPQIAIGTVGVIDPSTLVPAGTASRFVSACTGGSVDLDCHAGVPQGLELQRSVARLNFADDSGGISVCTGTLVRDGQGGASRPYLLTAAHCIDSPSEAASVEAIWFFFREGDVLPCLRDLPFNEGATLGATVASCDMSALVLSSSPPSNAVALPISTAVIGASERGFSMVHHSAGASQRYWTRPAATRGSCAASDGAWSSPTSYELRFVEGESSGTVEGGASGAALVDSQGRVRGTLRGVCYPGGSGFDFCARRGEVRTFFGSLAEAWRLGLSEAFRPPPPDDAFEPNNSLAQARPIGATGAVYPLRLLDLDDYFSITLVTPGRLEITLSGTPTESAGRFDPDLFLLNVAGAELARSDSSAASESIVLDLAAGTYIVRVKRFTEGTDETGSYLLTPRFTTSVPPPAGGVDMSPPEPLPSGSGSVPPPTSPLVDRQVTVLGTRFDRLLNAATLRGQRVVDGLALRIGRLRSRGASEEVITRTIDATGVVVEALRLSTTLGLVRSADGTTRVLDRLSLRGGEIAQAAEVAKQSTVPTALAAALDRVTETFDGLASRVAEVRAGGG